MFTRVNIYDMMNMSKEERTKHKFVKKEENRLEPFEKFVMGIFVLFVTIIATIQTGDSFLFQIKLFAEIRSLFLWIGYGTGAFLIGGAILDWKRGF
jgi:hypothetical protein